MTRRRSSPLGLELVLSVVLALVVLPLLSHGAPVQDSHADLQRYSDGCYYNYNHYSEGDRILTNEPCLNCTCHNKMLMCYLRVCPFTKPIGHDCTVEKREDQCCPIVTCPEVPVDVSHHSHHQLTTNAPGTELSIPEKYGCSIDNKFYIEGAQVPSNPNKPCELCYCIRNRTSCLMQECTLHIDGCQPIYNKGSCCPVRYNCDHENELLEIEDFSTTTTTVRPTPGYVLSSTTSPAVTTDCIHNNEVYADGASITGKSSCEHCYCMRGDIVCAVQECEMPTLESGGKTCRALPPAAGECCPSNYVCDDDSVTTGATLHIDELTTILPMVQSDLHESVSQEDVQLQEHIDDKIAITELPGKSEEHPVEDVHKDEISPSTGFETTITPIAGDVPPHSEEEEDKHSEEEGEKPLHTTVSAIKETSYETTQSPIEKSTTHKTEEEIEQGHQDNVYDSTKAPIEDEIINEEKEDDVSKSQTTVSPIVGTEDDVTKSQTTVSPIVGDIEKMEEEELVPSKDFGTSTESDESTQKEEDLSKVTTTAKSIIEEKQDEIVPSTEGDLQTGLGDGTSSPLEEDIKKIVTSTPTSAEASTSVAESADSKPIDEQTQPGAAESDVDKIPTTQDTLDGDSGVSGLPSKPHIEHETSTVKEETSSESVEFSEETPLDEVQIQDKIDQDVSEPSSITGSTTSPIYETVTERVESPVGMPEIGDHKTESTLPKKKPKDEPEIIEGTTYPSDMDVNEQTATDNTTKHSPIEGLSVTDAPSTGSEMMGSDAEEGTVVPGHKTESESEAVPDVSTEGFNKEQQKPITEDDVEIPAFVEEITDTKIKPASEKDIPTDQDTIDQTTEVPMKELGVEDVSGSSEKEDDAKPAVPSAHDEEKPTATSRPVRINIAGEEEEYTESPFKGTSGDFEEKKPEKDLADSTTSTPDSSTNVFEKEGESSETSDESTTMKSVKDSKKPSTETLEVSGEPGVVATTKLPTLDEDKTPSDADKDGMKVQDNTEATNVSDEEGDKPKHDDAVPAPTKTSEEEKDDSVHEHSTQSSIVSETTISDEDKKEAEQGDLDYTPPSTEEGVKGKPHIDVDDSTTKIPLLDESDEEEDQVKIEADEDVEKPTKSVASNAEPEEKQKEKPEHGVIDATTTRPSLSEDKTTRPEEDKYHGSSSDDSAESTEEDDMKHQSEESIEDMTTMSSAPKEGAQSNSEEHLTTTSTLPKSEAEGVTKEPHVFDLTTSLPDVDNSKIEEDGVKETQTTISPSSPASDTPTSVQGQPEISITDSPTTGEPALDKEITEKQPEQSAADSTTTDSSVDSQPISDEDKLHDKPSPSFPQESIYDVSTQGQTPEILPTIVPSLSDSGTADSGEDLQNETNEVLSDSTTQSPSKSHPSQEDEEIENQTTHKEGIIAPSESSTPGKEQTKIEQLEVSTLSSDSQSGVPTTLAPSVTSSQEQNIEGQEEKYKPEQNILDHTTTVPTSEQTTAKSEEDKKDADQEDILRTTLSPITPTEKAPSVSYEGSGHDIIPSAIPGEGDCLVDNKTYSNNATVPTSNECELYCSCVSSIVVCQKVHCYEPPQLNNCVLDEASNDRCCPQYICEMDSSAEDLKPATPEDNEDEEMQSTTLEPTRIHSGSTVSTPAPETQPEKDATVSPAEDELIPTKKPTISSDFSTPEMSSEDTVPHIEDKDREETSTEVDISEESTVTSTSTPTIKPTKQVTGDIEPIEISDTTKKPIATEESTTLRGISAEEQVVTVTPSVQEASSVGDAVTEVSTDSTESSPVSKPSTSQPSKTEVPTEAPISSAVDVAQSGETIETSDEVSTESDEELTDSEEGTKSPLLLKEDAQEVTTFKTIASHPTELPGSMPTVDGTTIIPEIDYKKPAMPEDLSHTKVEPEELPTKTEKPAKPITSEESGESEESEEITEKTIMPHKSPESTVLLPVDSTEDDFHKEKPLVEISDKTDDMPSSESEEEDNVTKRPEVEEQKPISPTSAPVKTEEPESVTKKDEIASQTTSPVSVPSDDSSLEKEQTPTQTSAPDFDKQPSAGTLAPELEEESNKDKDAIPSGTSAPAVEAHSIEGSGTEVPEDNLVIASSTSHPSAGTLAPELEEGSIKDKDVIPSGTSAPAIEGSGTEVPEDMLVIASSTSHPSAGTLAPELEEGSIKDEDVIPSETSAPAVEGSGTEEPEDMLVIASSTSHPSAGTIAPELEEEPNKDKDVIPSGTSAPTVKDHSVEGSSTEVEDNLVIGSSTSHPSADQKPISATLAPVLEEEANKETDDVTTIPSLDEHSVEGSGGSTSPDESHEIASPTSSPVTEQNEMAKPISEGKPGVEQDEFAGQTSAPTITQKPIGSGIEDEEKTDVPSQTSSSSIEDDSIEGSGAPIPEDEQDNKTTKPISGDGSIEGSGAPTSEVESNEVYSPTTSPAVEKIGTKDDGKPISEDKSDVEQDAFAGQTTVPTIGEKPLVSGTEDEDKIDVTSQTTSASVEDHPIEGSGATISEDEQDNKTTKPIMEEGPFEGSGATTPKYEHDKKTAKPISETGAGAPISEDEIDKKTTDGPISEPESVEGTISPISDDEFVTDKGTKYSQTTTPSSESTAASSTETVKEVQTNAPTISDKPKPIAPASEAESDVQNLEVESQTNVPVKSLEDSLSMSTDAPTTQEILDKKDLSTLKPTSENEEEIMPVSDKYEETELPEDKHTSTEQEHEAITVATGMQTEDASEPPADLLPSKDVATSDETTTTPLDAVKPEDEDVDGTERTPIKPEKESDNESKTTSTPIPLRTNDEVLHETTSVKTVSDDLDVTKSPESVDDGANVTKSPESVEEDMSVTKSTDLDSDKESIPTSTQAKVEGVTSSEVTEIPALTEESHDSDKKSDSTTVSTPKTDEEVSAETQAPSIADHSPAEKDKIAEGGSSTDLPLLHPDNQSPNAHTETPVYSDESTTPKEVVSIDSEYSHVGEQSSEEQPHIDKNLIQTERPLVEGETTRPVSQKEEQDLSDLPLSITDRPEKETDGSITETPVMPEVISSHEIIPQSGKPESDDQVLSEEVSPSTDKPSDDVVPSKTESSIDQKKPPMEEAQGITESTMSVRPETNEMSKPSEKPVSVEDSSAEDEESSTSVPSKISPTDSLEILKPSEKPVSVEDSSVEDEESSTSVPSKISPTESHEISKPSEKPVSVEDSSPEDEESSTSVPSKISPTESHEISKPTEKPVSVEDSSAEDEESSTSVPSKISPEKPVSVEDSSAEDEESSTSVPSKISPTESHEISKPTEKPVSVEDSSAEDEESSTSVPSKISPEKPVSVEDSSAEDEESSTSVPSKISPTESNEISKPSEKPVSVEDSSAEDNESKTPVPFEISATETPASQTETSSVSSEKVKPLETAEQDILKITTTRPAEDIASAESEEGMTIKDSTTISPIDSDINKSSSEDGTKPSEKPKDDTKIQTVAEFVTDRPDELTTVAPIQDENKKPDAERPPFPSTGESSTSSSEEEETKKPEPSITTEKVVTIPSVEESEQKTPSPEIPSEISEEDHKIQDRPTGGSLPSTGSDKPSEEDAADLPKPIVSEEQTSSEEETPSPTTVHPLFPHIEPQRTTMPPGLNASDKIDVGDIEPIDASPSSASPTTEQPTSTQSITNAPTSHYQPPGYGQVPPYPSYAEDEYTDEDETEVFGPGTCRYGGKLFVSAQQIPRDDPCDFCFCFRSDIICLQQSCPPPISGCHEEPISGFCCPRYECPVSMATTLNITTSTTTTSTTLPPHFLHHAYRGAAAKNGCHISGKSYKVGDKIDSASGPCMHCTCGGDGQMKCDPKTCSPEPMLQQMIAVVASRRR